jgi:hypothetical protein
MRKFATDVPLATNNLLLYTVVVASAPFQSFAHAVCSKQHRRQQQWAAPRAHKAQSIFSCWSWAEDGAVCQEHIKFFGETSKNFEGTLKCTLKFFGETFFHFFHSLDFLHSILLIGEFQIFVVEYLNIWTYLNYSNFPVPPQFKRFLAIDRRIMKKRFFLKKMTILKKDFKNRFLHIIHLSPSWKFASHKLILAHLYHHWVSPMTDCPQHLKLNWYSAEANTFGSISFFIGLAIHKHKLHQHWNVYKQAAKTIVILFGSPITPKTHHL